MKDIKLVTIDLDGTLLSSQKIISPEAVSVIKEKEAQGVKITIATGRTFESARSYFEQLDLAVPVITSNGARILDNQKVYQTLQIPIKAVRTLFDMAIDKGLSVIYTIDGLEYVYQVTPWVEYQRKQKGLYMRDHNFSESEWESVSVEKIMVWNDNTERSVSIIEKDLENLKEYIRVVQYANRCYEIMHPQATKANGAKFVAEYLGIPMSQVMHIGDDVNDVILLEEAGYSVAPANSQLVALEVARYRSPYKRTEAVIDALTQFT